MPGTPSSSRAAAAAGGGGSGGFDAIASPLHPALVASAATFGAANRAFACRVQIGKTGTLRDFAVFVNAGGGNVDAGIYDTASPRARLWSSGTVATPAAGAWRIIGDPALAVTALDLYDFVLCTDSAAAQFGRIVLVSGNAVQLPANYLPGLGGTPWQAWFVTQAPPLPATIAEAGIAGTTSLFVLMCRVV